MIDVALVTDRAFLPWCATTLRSAAEATEDAELLFHVLVTADVSQDERDRLRRAAAVGPARAEFVELDDALLADLPSKGAAGGGRICWARTVLADVLGHVERLIYLDGDVLVRRSLRPLWDALDGRPIAAVTNVTEPAMHAHLRSLGIDDPRGYFNAGVLVIDLAAWRAESAGDELRRVATSRPVPWYDQDALNVVFTGRWKRLSPVWNAMNSVWGWPEHAAVTFPAEELEAARRDPAVVHFEGPHVVKPWHYLSTHPFKDEFRAVLARTPWADRPLDGRTPATRAIALLPEKRRLPAHATWERSTRRLDAVRRRLVNASARGRAKVRNPRVITAVSPDDNMLFEGTLELYFETGEDAFRQIRVGLAAAGVGEPRRVLDVPSGYGRVLRYMRAAWPRAELAAMEIREGAPAFCAEAFAARPVQSGEPLWSVEGVGDDFDLVWSGSLLSHFDSDAWVPTLRFLRDRLRPGGALIFTTHGNRSLDLLARDPAAVDIVRSVCAGWTGDYGVRDAAAMVHRARESGFAFEDYRWEPGPKWGVSVSRPEWVRATVEAAGGLGFVLHVPHGWSENQDVWTYVRRAQ